MFQFKGGEVVLDKKSGFKFCPGFLESLNDRRVLAQVNRASNKAVQLTLRALKDIGIHDSFERIFIQWRSSIPEYLLHNEEFFRVLGAASYSCCKIHTGGLM